MQQKIRINDLARELEVKSRAILDVLLPLGITEKKTHSSSLETDEAEKVRVHFRGQQETVQLTTSRLARPARTEDEIKTKVDLSHISKPGDVLRAITQRVPQPAAPVRPAAPPMVELSRPAVVPPAAAVPPRPSVPVPLKPEVVPEAEAPKPRRVIMPQPRQPSAVVAPPPSAGGGERTRASTPCGGGNTGCRSGPGS